MKPVQKAGPRPIVCGPFRSASQPVGRAAWLATGTCDTSLCVIGNDPSGAFTEHPAGQTARQNANDHDDRDQEADLADQLALPSGHGGADHGERSEEHTSELQSLMRSPYA